MRPQPSSPAEAPAARDFTMPQMEPAPLLALKRPVVPLFLYLGMLVICILKMGMLSEKPMCLGSQHAAPQAKNFIKEPLPPLQPTWVRPLAAPLPKPSLHTFDAPQVALADLHAAVAGGHFSGGRGGSIPAQERPASASSAGFLSAQDTRSSPMKGPLGVVFLHLPSGVWHSEPSMAHSLISSSAAVEALVSFSSALLFCSAAFLAAFSALAARSALAFFWPASCMSFWNARSALAAFFWNFSAVAARALFKAAASAAAFLA